MRRITVVGGGLAGLVAAIASAEAGAQVHLYEAHATVGGRGRATPPPYIAHDGPHVLYDDGPAWGWLAERDLIGPAARVGLREAAGLRFRWDGGLHRLPPAVILRMLAHRNRRAPVDRDFRSWMTEWYGPEAAETAANLLGVVTFDADPARLSAAFAWERLVRVFTALPPAARYIRGGWNCMLDRLQARAVELGVVIQQNTRIQRLPEPPVIVATSLEAARGLLGDDTLRWESGRTALLDLGLTRRRGDAFLVFDCDEAGFMERYSSPDPTVAPAGQSLVQAQMPMRPGESKADAVARLERMLDSALPGWRDRTTWRRSGIANGRSGALDLPGHTWRDRPAIHRGQGVFLAGDMVAAPGLLSEVAFNSAVEASRGALDAAGIRPATRQPEPVGGQG